LKKQRRGLWGSFSPPFPFKNVLTDKKGSTYYDLIIKTVVVITLMATVMSFLSIFTTYLNVSHICRRVVRTIELEGQISDNVYDVFNKLKEQTGLSPEMSVMDVNFCDEENQRIQLRDTFTVRMRYNKVFTIFTPSFAPPVEIVIPIEADITGMSEKYWKVTD
jgi:hypothetical protein